MKPIHFLFLLFFLIVHPAAHAGEAECPADAVHCSYVTGLSNQVADGRFIKLSNSKVGNIVICFNNFSASFIDEYGAAAHLGKNADYYSICADEKGSRCEPLGLDFFVITQKSNGYVADPKYFAIDLSKVKNNYPSCT